MNNTFITEFKNISEAMFYLAETLSVNFKDIDHKVMSILIYGAALSFGEKENADEATIIKAFKETLIENMKYTPDEANKIHSDIISAFRSKKKSIIEIVEQGREMFKDFEEIIEGLRCSILDRLLYSRQLISNG